MPDWLQPWIQPTVVIAAVGALFAGIGALVTRLSVAFVLVMPEVRVTAEWWDDRQERRARARQRAGGRGGGRGEPLPTASSTTPSAGPLALARSLPQRPPEPVSGRQQESTQLALPLDEASSTSSTTVRRAS